MTYQIIWSPFLFPFFRIENSVGLRKKANGTALLFAFQRWSKQQRSHDDSLRPKLSLFVIWIFFSSFCALLVREWQRVFFVRFQTKIGQEFSDVLLLTNYLANNSNEIGFIFKCIELTSEAFQRFMLKIQFSTQKLPHDRNQNETDEKTKSKLNSCQLINSHYIKSISINFFVFFFFFFALSHYVE